MRTYASLILGILFAGLAGIVAAPAQDLPGDAEAGQALAVALCAACHAVEEGAPDAAAGQPAAFQSLADDPAMTALALRVFMRTSHRDMPNLILTDTECDDIIVYILGLRSGR